MGGAGLGHALGRAAAGEVDGGGVAQGEGQRAGGAGEARAGGGVLLRAGAPSFSSQVSAAKPSPRGFERARPSGVRTPTSAPEGETRTAGRSTCVQRRNARPRGEAGDARPALPEDEPERAERDEGHHEGLWRGDVGDRAGEGRDGAGDEEDPVDAGLHEAEADLVEAEGREEGREDGGGHHEHAHDGDGQRVGEEAVVLELVEVGGGEGGRRRCPR